MSISGVIRDPGRKILTAGISLGAMLVLAVTFIAAGESHYPRVGTRFLSPPLKKGDLGGFQDIIKIPPSPLFQRGVIISPLRPLGRQRGPGE